MIMPIQQVKRLKDGRRAVKSYSSLETVYGLFTKRGKIFYVGRTGKPLDFRLEGHVKQFARMVELGRVTNPVMAEMVLKKGVQIRALSSPMSVEQAKFLEDALLKSFKPVANIRGTGRACRRAKNLTDADRELILSQPDVPCEVLALQFKVAPCTISIVRRKAREAK